MKMVVNTLKQIIFNLFVFLFLAFLVFDYYVENEIYAVVFGVVIFILLFSDEILRPFRFKVDKVFADVSKNILTVHSYGYLLRKKITIDFGDVEKIIECGPPGRRKFIFKFHGHSKDIKLSLERLLGFSYKKEMDEEFLVLLNKSYKGKIEHLFNC